MSLSTLLWLFRKFILDEADGPA